MCTWPVCTWAWAYEVLTSIHMDSHPCVVHLGLAAGSVLGSSGVVVLCPPPPKGDPQKATSSDMVLFRCPDCKSYHHHWPHFLE